MVANYRIHGHTVRHGDILDENIKNLTTPKSIDLYYSDPPWSSGNLKYWQTINKKQNRDAEFSKTTDEDVFLARLMDLVDHYAKDLVVLEYSKKYEALEKAIKAKGFHISCIAASVYNHQNLKHVIVFAGRKPRSLAIELHRYKGLTLVNHIFSCLEPLLPEDATVMDLCCGMGYTAKAAIKRGWTFVGNEINKNRLQKTIKALNNGIIPQPR